MVETGGWGTVGLKVIGRVTNGGWELLPVSDEQVGQEWPNYD